jgi:hypothetical protein
MRATADRLAEREAFLHELQAQPFRHDFYAAMRRIECLFDDKPRIGQAVKPSDEPLRLGQDVSLTFAPAPIAELRPGQGERAPKLLQDASLLSADPTKPFAPVNVLSYQSTVDPLVHVIGDASLTTQPKAGHIGNQQGKTCADAILRLLSGRPMNSQVVTNSACYTPITATTATWLSAMYQYDPGSKTMVILPQHNNGKAIAASSATSDNYQDMQRWFTTLMGETFS